MGHPFNSHISVLQNYTDPNILSYSWLPSMNMKAILSHPLIQEKQEKGPGTLQVCIHSTVTSLRHIFTFI